uniref:Uncharacterized protein n=1 Tax=Homalodisca liturata TaxID=320908 RepID=A0A1B6IF07_9HEMI
MGTNSSLRSWINRLMGPAEEAQGEEAAGTSGPSSPPDQPQTSAGHSAEAASSSVTSVTSKDSTDSTKEPRSKKPFLARYKKGKGSKLPNVMRSSVVGPQNEIIPPLTNLAPGEEPDRKLARVLEKFNTIDLTEETTPPADRKLAK